MAIYDRIGENYTDVRRPDPRIARQIRDAIGDASSLVNVGAGAGAYEPADLEVVAVEPSARMIGQRRSSAARVLQARAEDLPFPDNSFDVALAVLTVHHWDDWPAGLAHMQRVARRRVVILTWDPVAAAGFWLHDYLPEMATRDAERFMPFDELCSHLGRCRVEVVPIPADCSDGFLAAYWRRPHAYLDPRVRAGISSFSLGAAVSEGLGRLASELDNGAWKRRWGYLLDEEEQDLGYRLLVVD